MATKSKIAREKQLAKLISHKGNQEKRNEYKAILKSKDAKPAEKMFAMFALENRKAEESPTRHTRRCWKCGRPKGVYRKFALCRCCIFDAMRRGWLVGFRKASW